MLEIKGSAAYREKTCTANKKATLQKNNTLQTKTIVAARETRCTANNNNKKKLKVHEKRGAAANLKGPRQINKNTNIIRFRGSLHKDNGYPVHGSMI